MEKKLDKQYILDNFDQALQERWITVYYQPIVRAVNCRVCDEEALARWIDPVLGFLSPADFIPVLEESKLIYKLDLYMLDRVLEKMKFMVKNGYHMVSQSINLSRSDFDMCDMVEEVVKRVDKSGIPRNKINIEITESILVNDFKFMLSQIDHFKSLGFSVWMDDFGSGYSSLNTLSRIPFDLLKFDMVFMRNFDSGENGKIILAELMRMAEALGKDTVCEGVENKEQVEFLQEIGCSKLQGFYYSPPVPIEKIIERCKSKTDVIFEDPKESQYSELIGRINLHDLSVLSQSDKYGFTNFFNTFPMAIMEIDSETVRYIRANKSYGDFMQRYFSMKQERDEVPIKMVMQGPGAGFMMILKQAARDGKPMFVDERLPEGSKAHYYISRLVENPLTKKISIVIAVLSVVDAGHGETYANIARALATDYFNLFYVNLETEEFIEYSSNVGEDEISTERHGINFFKECRKAVPANIYEDDVQFFLESFSKEKIIKILDEQGTFILTYRMLKYGVPCHVSMKVTRMQNDKKYIIMGISNVDAQMKEKMQLEKAKQDKIVFSRIMALSGDYICIYIIDLKTDAYIEYQASEEFQKIGIQQKGNDFFADTQVNADKAVAKDDREYFKNIHTKDNILKVIKKDGVFKSRHQLLINGESLLVSVRCVLTKENGEDKLIMGIRKV